ncbi:hypothetical protein ESP51_10165 [Agromyces albus]|uniref:Uncharacterized protein n=2 Tax=Agromyces albus TaxID=205332 RepID=A0A4Q2L1K9_9MICO|nr:hypothetical protein ESP51_10165 [Agromyces albus]
MLALPRAIGFPLSRDELATATFASLSPGEQATAVTLVDAVATPYYLLVHAVTSVLPGDLGIRLPSLVATAVAAVAVGVLAGRWWGVHSSAAAAALLAANPLMVALAATARPAATATVCVALALLCADIAISARGQSAVVPWVGFVAATVGAGVMHLFSLLAVIPVIALALRRGRRAAVSCLLAAVASAVVICPFAWWASSQTGQVSWIPAVEAPVALAILSNLVTSPDRLALDVLDALGLVAIALGTGAALVIAARARQIDPIVRLTFAFGVAVLPWLTLLAVSAVSPVLRTGYLAPSTIGVALIGASLVRVEAPDGAAWVRHRIGARFVGAVLLAGILASTIPANVRAASAGFRHDDFPGLASELLAHAEPGDMVAVVQRRHETGLAAGVARYAGDEAFGSEVRQRLAAASALSAEVRQIVATAPLQTTQTPARAWAPNNCSAWVVSAGELRDDDVHLLRRLGIVKAVDDGESRRFGGLRLTPARCDR